MNRSITSWDGTLTMNEFSTAARFFAEKWRTKNSALPPWSWVDHRTRNFASFHDQVIGYLSLERFCLFGLSEEEVCGDGGEESSFLEKVDAVDDATLVQSDDRQVHYYDFHIVYSDSYMVPVLYFRAYCDDGQPLALNEIEKDLPAGSVKVLLETKWTFITQESFYILIVIVEECALNLLEFMQKPSSFVRPISSDGMWRIMVHIVISGCFAFSLPSCNHGLTGVVVLATSQTLLEISKPQYKSDGAWTQVFSFGSLA